MAITIIINIAGINIGCRVMHTTVMWYQLGSGLMKIVIVIRGEVTALNWWLVKVAMKTRVK